MEAIAQTQTWVRFGRWPILSGAPLVAPHDDGGGEERVGKDNVAMLTSPTPGKPWDLSRQAVDGAPACHLSFFPSLPLTAHIPAGWDGCGTRVLRH